MDFIDILKFAKNDGKVVSVFSNQDDAYKAGVGYVLEVDDSFFVMANISETGTYDGYSIRRCENIFRIDMECEYELRYKRAFGTQSHKHIEIENNSPNLLVNFFRTSQEHNFIVGVGVNDFQISVRGLVENIDVEKHILMLSEVSDNGEKTGNIFISFDSIFRANADDETDRFIKNLYEIAK